MQLTLVEKLPADLSGFVDWFVILRGPDNTLGNLSVPRKNPVKSFWAPKI